jgi:hypothetical protein
MPQNHRKNGEQRSAAVRISTLLLRALFSPIWLIGSMFVTVSMWVRPVGELAASRNLQPSADASNSRS